MNHGDLAILAWCDLGAIMRTRAIPLDQLDAKRRHGVGWAAAGSAMTPFDGIVENPWGPLEEVRQVPVEGASVSVGAREGIPAFHLYLTRTLAHDGSPGDCCPRNFCEAALKALEAETGWTLWSAFEHEFTAVDPPFPLGAVYSVESLRYAAPFAAEATAALRPLGLECFEPEFGKGQFEVSCAPQAGLQGPDRALLTREVIREVARRHSVRMSFSPKPAPLAAGSGMHIHFSFQDREGRPVLHDAMQPGLVTPRAAAFIGGVMRHIDAITAISAPTPASYLRLGPGHWSCGYAAFGVQNREAALRVCPSVDTAPLAAAAATNLELRPPDGTCNPYLAIGALALAGLAGIQNDLPLPAIIDRDPQALSDAERQRLKIKPLPASLAAALDALAADEVARGWLPPRLYAAFVAIKRMEAARFAYAKPDVVTRAYRDLY
jgi:glutamine synthetase